MWGTDESAWVRVTAPPGRAVVTAEATQEAGLMQKQLVQTQLSAAI